MKALIKHQNALVEANRSEYGHQYEQLNFVNYYQGIELEEVRNNLLTDISPKIKWAFKETKTDATAMSPGCQLCGQGQWSCLFINGKCNCNCFYCPAPQTDIGNPVTQTLTFDEPMSYVEYIKKFNFKGVSFSGGEPFLTYDKVKLFLTTLRQHLSSDLYIWMYTNGTKVTVEQLKELAALGLNEIRYDIGATDYNLKPVKQAIGIIPIVTVEIPAVPHELETLKQAVKELAHAGLSYLNLHQLRLTPHNLKNLTDKGYLFAHGQRVTVPQSEITALEIIKFTKEHHLQLPVNYCSFVYKNRFQKSGLRKKLAPHIIESFQEITENGYIRSLSVDNNINSLGILQMLKAEQIKLTFINNVNNRIYFHSSLLSLFKQSGSIHVKYTDVRLLETNNGINCKEIKLGKKEIWIEWADKTSEIEIVENEIVHFEAILNGQKNEVMLENEKLFQIMQTEQIESGLAEIY